MAKISIIIPHYNSWEFLKELLLTIPRDNMFEVIIVDDHSNNNVSNLKVIKEMFPHIKILINDTNKKGAGAARNVGLREAKGEWLLFADSDDLFLANLEKKVTPYLNSDYDIVYFTPTSFFSDSNNISKRHQQLEKYVQEYNNYYNQTNELRLRYYYQVPWSKLIRHSLVKQYNIQFDEVMVSNDTMFSAKIGHYANKIDATAEEIYSVRQSEGSLTSVVTDKRYQQRIDVWVDLVAFIKNNNTKEVCEKLNISLLPQVFSIVTNRLSLSTLLYLLKKGRANNINIIDKRIFNIRFLFAKLKENLS